MKLTTRLWLSGALLPLSVMALVWIGADRVFCLALERSLDQALLAQAAVESVSLFDGPQGQPHLHMATSPLVESVRPFAPEGVLFGPDGHQVMRYPPTTRSTPDERLIPGTPGAPPELSTQQRDGVRTRVLTVSVASPRGRPYTLRLTATMAQLDTAIGTFRRLTLFSLLAAALVLLGVQTVQARKLSRRLRELTEHSSWLRRGDLDHSLSPERERDELAELRDVLMQATLALKQARDAEERLLADAAHELRTPLTLMRTSLDLALRRERTAPELRSALRDAREEVDRLAHLSTSLLDMAALQHARRPQRPCDLSALVDDAVEAARAEAESRGVRLCWEAHPSVMAQVNPESVRQAVDNLLSNALKYARAEVRVQLVDEPEAVVLLVSDDGPGIPEPERQLVFEPFHRVRGSAPGAGLGLAIVRQIALAHHGAVRVAPAARGTTMELVLRRA